MIIISHITYRPRPLKQAWAVPSSCGWRFLSWKGPCQVGSMSRLLSLLLKTSHRTVPVSNFILCGVILNDVATLFERLRKPVGP
jgi:hypothetical protein